jgi:hypothetical protein
VDTREPVLPQDRAGRAKGPEDLRFDARKHVPLEPGGSPCFDDDRCTDAL